MDFGSITQFLGNKTIFVTGTTGFIAKIFLEKILRIQPNVNKVYVLIRATDAKSAHARLLDEVLSKELFSVLRTKMGVDFETFALEKIMPIAGDTSCENLGLNEDQLQEMYENIDIVVNVAATTKFKERYEVALGVNTFGAINLVNFAKKCSKLQLLIHVSTAYVCGEKATGLTYERPIKMGETLNGVTGLDIDSERKIVEQALCNLKDKDLSEKEIKQRMVTLGDERAKLYGWPNPYEFTKAMGEMVIGEFRGNLPVVIMRPTIVCSTLREPFPGWIEGFKGFESFATSYGKGSLSVFPADNDTVIDLIPADIFVNSIILAMKAHISQPCLTVYQVGTSFRNPITFKQVHEYLFQYFTKNPWINPQGNLVKARKMILFSNISIFKIAFFLWQFIVQMGLDLATKMGFTSFQRILKDINKSQRITKILAEIFTPFLIFNGIFVDTNAEKLLIRARDEGLDEDNFNIDPRCIDWKHYFFNVHFPSMVKYLF